MERSGALWRHLAGLGLVAALMATMATSVAAAASFQQVVQEYEAALKANDFQAASQALMKAGQVDDPRAVSWLHGILTTQDKDQLRYGRYAASSLATIGSPPALAVLRQVLAQGTDTQKMYVLQGLAQHPDKARLEDFAGSLDSKNQAVRMAAVRGLIAIKDPKAAPLLLDSVADPVEGNAGSSQRRLNQEIYKGLKDSRPKDAAKLLSELLKGRQTCRSQRVLGLRLAADWRLKELEPLVTRHLRVKDAELRELAVLYLGRLDDEDNLRTLKKMLRDRDGSVARAAAAAIGMIPGGDASRILFDLLRERRAGLQIVAVQELGERQYQDAFEPILKMLDDEPWQLRSAVIGALRRYRLKEAIPALIPRLKEEEGRMLGEVLEALRDLSGKWEMRADALAWEVWWQSHGADHVVPVAQSGPKQGEGRTVLRDRSYFGIEVRSQRVVFIIDVSGSMSAKFPEGNGGRQSTGTSKEKNPYAGVMRLDAVKQELRKLIQRFDRHTRFNIIAFDHGQKPWSKTLQPATDEVKTKALDWVQALKPSGGTNIYDPLALAFEEAEVDTIFLLTDGSPGSGTYTSTEGICQGIARINRARRIAIHTINFAGMAELLKRLAKENSGKYVELR